MRFTLDGLGFFTLLVLGDLVNGVLLALSAISSDVLGTVNLESLDKQDIKISNHSLKN